MKKYTSIIFLFIIILFFPQNNKFNFNQNNSFIIEHFRLKKEFNINKLRKKDVANCLLNAQNERLCFYGEKYQRAYLKFTHLKVSSNSIETKGIVQIKNKNFIFSGIIIPKKYGITEYKDKALESFDDKDIEKRNVNRYSILCEIRLKNNILGDYIGSLIINTYYDKKLKKYVYDDLDPSDSYKNNQSVGYWKINDKYTIFNWGNNRIPNSGDLDIGIGEFSPNKKYYKNGWKNFIKHSNR